jgi:hypothetical protein
MGLILMYLILSVSTNPKQLKELKSFGESNLSYSQLMTTRIQAVPWNVGKFGKSWDFGTYKLSSPIIMLIVHLKFPHTVWTLPSLDVTSKSIDFVTLLAL